MSDQFPQRTQLPLPISLPDEASFDFFHLTAAAGPVVRALEQQLSPLGEPTIVLHGPVDSGKSHLLQAACHLAGEALYLPLAQLRDFPPEEVLLGVERLKLVCLDDIQAVTGIEAWERALFNLCNAARHQGGGLLLAATAAPRELSFGLEDLRSRLNWGLVFRLPRVDDEDKAAILRLRAKCRGLSMPEDVARFIVSRAERGLTNLIELLDRLDQASLAEQRVLSVPFVRRVLGPALAD